MEQPQRERLELLLRLDRFCVALVPSAPNDEVEEIRNFKAPRILGVAVAKLEEILFTPRGTPASCSVRLADLRPPVVHM